MLVSMTDWYPGNIQGAVPGGFALDTRAIYNEDCNPPVSQLSALGIA